MMSLFAKPMLGPDTLTARPYQVEAIDAVRREFTEGKRRTLVIHPTGVGKTVLFSKISRATVDRGGRVLILAHRDELIQQALNTLDRVGILAGVEKAESQARAAFDPDVVVASVQTMQRKRLLDWPTDHFRLVIVDEAHHATAPTYQAVLKHFRSARVLGVTATPDRADEDMLSDVFESVAHEMTIWQAMTAPEPGPYLCRLRFVQCDVGIDLRGIRTTCGDFNMADLEDKLRPNIETLANAIKKEAGDRLALVFTPDVGSAQAMSTALQSLGVAADWVAGFSPDRAAKIKRFKAGDTRMLVNCAILTEGFDAPEVSAIALCRPTKSRSLYSQMVGRGTRLAPGKQDCLLIDFDFLTEKHDLVRPADLFDSTNTNPEVLAIADELLRATPGKDLIEVVEQARETQKEREVLRIKARERDVRYRTRVSYDPLAAADTLGIAMRGSVNAIHDPPTNKQCEILGKFGIQNPEKLSRRRASRMLDVLFDRSRKKLATMKQCSWMIAKGMDPAEARAMTCKEASAYLSEKFGGRN